MKKILQASIVMLASMSANATTFGPIENFDVVNDTGKTAHGFHVRLHGVHPSELTSIFGATPSTLGSLSRFGETIVERYGSPKIYEGTDANGYYTDVVYLGTWDGSNWDVGTPSGTLPVNPTDSCWVYGATNYGPMYPCDHFGISTSVPATSVDYNWLLETATPGQLNLVVSNVPNSTWTPPAVPANPPAVAIQQARAVAPAAPLPPADVEIVQIPPPQPPAYEFGEPTWYKVTATGYGYNVAVEDLVAENDVVKKAANTQTEWQLLQYDSGNPNGSGKVDLTGVAPDPGYKSIVYRYELYEYTGEFNPETHEAITLDHNKSAGQFLGAQHAAINLDGKVPPAGGAAIALAIDAVLVDGVAGVQYLDANNSPIYISVTSDPNDTVNVNVTGLPRGLMFNAADNSITGVPAQIGSFNVNIVATDVTTNTSTSASAVMKVVDPAIVFKPALTSISAGALYSYQLVATGGDAPFNYAITSGTLPAGFSLDSTTGLITGSSDVASSTPLTFTVTDSVGGSATASSTLTVISLAKACSGLNDIVSGVIASGLEVGGGLAKGGKTIKYAKTVNFAPGVNTYAVGQWITYSGSTDDLGKVCVPPTMDVANQLKLTVPAFPSVVVSTAYPTYSFTVAGGWGGYTVGVSGLPTGMKFNSTATPGVYSISGTPTTVGTYPIAISVTDAKGFKVQNTTGSIAVTSAPVSCTKPAGATSISQNPYLVTAVNGSSFTVNGKVFSTLPCTAYTWNGSWAGMSKSIQVGVKVEVTSGYTSNGINYVTKANVDSTK